MGKLEELIEKFAFCPYCKHKVTFKKAAHRATACVAHLQCEGPCTHYFKWGSQFIGEGDYILNKLAVAAEFLSAGSLTQFNQRQGMLRGAKMHSVYYYDCVTNLVVPRVQIEAEAELEKQKEMLAALPFEQRGISTDWRRDSARRAAHGTNTTIAKHNHKIVDIRNQETKSTTGNAWKNEAHGMVHMLADFVDRKIELSSVDHDDCSTTSKIIDLYKSMMKQEHNIDARTVDNNDNWHGAKSYKKLWHSFVDQFTKPVFRASKRRNQTADSRDSIEAKEIARRQLRAAPRDAGAWPVVRSRRTPGTPRACAGTLTSSSARRPRTWNPEPPCDVAHAQGEAVAGESQCETQSSRNPRRQARLKPRAKAQLRLLKACCEAAFRRKKAASAQFFAPGAGLYSTKGGVSLPFGRQPRP